MFRYSNLFVFSFIVLGPTIMLRRAFLNPKIILYFILVLFSLFNN